jgi:hypothetical protein
MTEDPKKIEEAEGLKIALLIRTITDSFRKIKVLPNQPITRKDNKDNSSE